MPGVLKRCMTCKHFHPINEIEGYCDVRNAILNGNNAGCFNWEV